MESDARESRISAALRGVGAGLGAFTLLNLTGELIQPGFSANFLWIGAPGWLLAFGGGALCLSGLRSLRGGARALACAGALGLAACAWRDTWLFAQALSRGQIQTPAWFPASALTALVLSAIAYVLVRPVTSGPRSVSASGSASPREKARWLSGRAARALGFGGALAALPLVFVLTLGPTRYARSADCALVLGARVYDDGSPSLALADRTDEGVRLYHSGRVRYLLMSGGIDPGNGHSEAAVMRERAMAQGVPAEAILLDEAGDNTATSVRNTRRILEERGLQSVLAVSHYYHLPRLKLLLERTPLRASTCPARMSRRLAAEPYFVARELAAFYAALLLDTPQRLRSSVR